MIVFLTVINVILTVVIIVIVLLQQGKGSDLGSAFGGGSSNSMFGALGPSDFLGKLTYALVAIWLILSLLLAYLLKTEKELDSLLKRDSIWNTLKAFKNKKLFVADGNQFFNRPGPRLIESIEIFAEIIHPKLFNFKHEKKGWINFINN